VTERTSEIGLRKALGATPGDLFRQFVIEAGALTAVGGLLGVATGLAAGYIVPRTANIAVTITPAPIAIAVAVAVVVGLVFGVSRAPRGGASGQLVQINGNTLILTGANGDVTVTYTTTTTITKMSTATLADITAGECIFANGAKDSSGLITATSVRLAPKNSR